MVWSRVRASVLLLAVALLAAACGGNGNNSSSGGSGSASPTEIKVFAAASLTAAFNKIGQDWTAANPGAKVTFNFAGSQALATQIQQGAPADVFASADTKNMDKAVAAKAVSGTPVNFASNTLTIAVPPDNPAGVHSLRDLAKQGTKVVVCAPEVPCGSAAQKVEQSSGVTIKPVSEEQAVTDVLTKVESGEADAGLVYVTDVRAAAGKVKGVPFPESSSAVNTYPIAALGDSKHAKLAQAFVKLVTGSTGQSVLAAAGFAKP